MMKEGSVYLQGSWWCLNPSSLMDLKEAVIEPWELELVKAMELWWNSEPTMSIRTSGSTGNPKPIQLAKAAMEASAKRTIDYFEVSPGSKAGLALPVTSIAGMMMLVRAIIGRWDLVVSKPAIHATFNADELDFVALTPIQAQTIEQEDPVQWKSFKTVLIGGGSPNNRWLSQLSGETRVFESFGMTETISHLALRQLYPLREPNFRCLPGFAVRTNSQGVLNIRTPDGQEFITRDVVQCQDDHSFIWLGRMDDVINSGGLKIHPEAVEMGLQAIINQPFRCFGVPDADWGQVVAIRIHSEEVPHDWEEQKRFIESWSRDNLPKHHAPKVIEWAPLEQSWTGKWKRPRNHT
ncbi:MAG: AMP-binding protein [Flavobacteriales bacterium]